MSIVTVLSWCPCGCAATHRSVMRSSTPRTPLQNRSTAIDGDAELKRITLRIAPPSHSYSGEYAPVHVRNT